MLEVRMKILKMHHGFAVESRKPPHAVYQSSAPARLGGMEKGTACGILSSAGSRELSWGCGSRGATELGWVR